MNRFVAVLGMATAALLSSNSAHAAVEMCADPTARLPVELQGIVQEAVRAANEPRADDGAVDSVLIAVGEVPIPRFSYDAATGVGADWLSASPEPEPSEDVPWCATPDDPRCTPLGGGFPSGSVDGRAPLTAVAALAFARDGPTGQHKLHARYGLAPKAGASQRIERPPR